MWGGTGRVGFGVCYISTLQRYSSDGTEGSNNNRLEKIELSGVIRVLIFHGEKHVRYCIVDRSMLELKSVMIIPGIQKSSL